MMKESGRHNDGGTAGPDKGPGAADKRERRSGHRVKNEQGSGQGALSALSKMKMIERKKTEIQPAPEHPIGTGSGS